jgi:hypothetical protein
MRRSPVLAAAVVVAVALPLAVAAADARTAPPGRPAVYLDPSDPRPSGPPTWWRG